MIANGDHSNHFDSTALYIYTYISQKSVFLWGPSYVVCHRYISCTQIHINNTSCMIGDLGVLNLHFDFPQFQQLCSFHLW